MHDDFRCRNFIHDAVCIVDSARPQARKPTFKRLRLANAFKWCAATILQHTENSLVGFAIMTNPFVQLVEKTLAKG